MLDAQKKYSKSKEDYYEKAGKFLKKFLEEHGGKFNVEENQDKLGQSPYFFYIDRHRRVSECIIKDIYIDGNCIYADILERWHDNNPFEEHYEAVDFDELIPEDGELELFINELTDWQDD